MGECDKCDIKKEVKDFFDPSKGGFGLMHEKINKRPTWQVIGSVITIILLMISASFAYTTLIAKNAKDDNEKLENKIENLVTKNDFDKRLDRIDAVMGIK